MEVKPRNKNKPSQDVEKNKSTVSKNKDGFPPLEALDFSGYYDKCKGMDEAVKRDMGVVINKLENENLISPGSCCQKKVLGITVDFINTKDVSSTIKKVFECYTDKTYLEEEEAKFKNELNKYQKESNKNSSYIDNICKIEFYSEENYKKARIAFGKLKYVLIEAKKYILSRYFGSENSSDPQAALLKSTLEGYIATITADGLQKYNLGRGINRYCDPKNVTKECRRNNVIDSCQCAFLYGNVNTTSLGKLNSSIKGYLSGNKDRIPITVHQTGRAIDFYKGNTESLTIPDYGVWKKKGGDVQKYFILFFYFMLYVIKFFGIRGISNEWWHYEFYNSSAIKDEELKVLGYTSVSNVKDNKPKEEKPIENKPKEEKPVDITEKKESTIIKEEEKEYLNEEYSEHKFNEITEEGCIDELTKKWEESIIEKYKKKELDLVEIKQYTVPANSTTELKKEK